MSTAVRATITVFLFLVLSSVTFAQAQQGTGAASPIVTATASAGKVRYVSMGEVQQTRLQVFSSDGIQIFDSSYRDGNLIDWQLTDQQGARVKDGSYIFLITVKDFAGRTTQKYGSTVVEQNQIYLEQTNRSGLSQAEATALESSKEAETQSPVDRMGAAELNRTAGVATVTNSSNAAATSQKTSAAEKPGAGPTTADLAGTGTQNNIPMWLDNNGTLGDSSITEDNGKIGIGTATPREGFTLFTSGGTAKYMMSEWGSGGSVAFGGDNTNGPFLLSHTDSLGRATGNFTASRIRFGAQGFLFDTSPVTSPGQVRPWTTQAIIDPMGRLGLGTVNPTQRLEVVGSVKIAGAGNGIVFPDGTIMNTAANSPSGTSIIASINAPTTTGTIIDGRLPSSLARLGGANVWSGANVFSTGLSANNALITNVGNPVNAGDATNKAYVDANFVKFVPGAEQLSVGDANGTATMVNLRGGSTCCSGPGGHTPAFFKIFQNGSFVATGNLGIGSSPMEGKGYRTSWHTYKGAFRSGYADNEWDDANVGFFSWAGGSNSTASGLYALAFGDTNFARSTSSIAFGSGNEVKGAAGFSAGAGNRVCDTYGVALGNNARSGGPFIDGKCDPETFNIRGLAAVAIGYNVTADQDHTMALGKFASNNGFQGTFIWSDGAPQVSADTFRNTANNEFAARATGGFRFRTNLGGTTGCNLPAGSGVFNCTSSRYTKENFLMIGGEDVLSRLRNVPVSSWNYISEGKKVRHIGPMAEDFFKAFGLGTSNTSIGVQDLAGVNLAAVKALDERTAELQRKTLELQQKTAEVEQLRSRVNTLEERMANMERAMQANQAAQVSQDK